MILYPGLISSDFLITEDGGQHAVRLYLWESIKDKENYLCLTNNLHVFNSDGQATMSREEYVIGDDFQYLGDLHFVKGMWDVGLITHELTHLLIHYIRGCVKEFARTIYLFHKDEEEDICYEVQYWADYLHNWLTKKDTPTKVLL